MTILLDFDDGIIILRYFGCRVVCYAERWAIIVPHPSAQPKEERRMNA